MTSQPNHITFNTPHSITLSVNEWLGVLCAVVNGRQHNAEHGWNATAEAQDVLLERLRAQVSEQIDAAGEDEETA